MDQAKPFKDLVNKYLANIDTYINADAFSELPSLKDEEIIPFIRNRTAKYKEICKEDDAIIAELFGKYKDGEKILDDEAAKQLENAADLFTTKYPSRESGLGLEIYKLVLDYFSSRNDLDSKIRMLYKCGLATYYSTNASTPDENPYFRQFFNYRDQYFTLSKESRLYFCRGLGNTLIGQNEKTKAQVYQMSFDYGDKIIAFFQRDDVRALDPDFQFDKWILLTHKNLTTFLQTIRIYKYIIPLKDRELTYQHAEYAYLHAGEFYKADEPIKLQTEYAYYASLFHAERITLEDLLNNLNKMHNRPVSDPYSPGSIYLRSKVPSYILEYYSTYSEDNPQVKHNECDRIFNEVLSYLQGLGKNKNYTAAQDGMLAFITASLVDSDLPQIQDRLFSLTIKIHLPTYAHTKMVTKLSLMLADYLYDHRPDYFLGCSGLETMEAINNPVNRKTFFDCFAEGCLFHDIGKYYCLNAISTCYRSLSPNEEKLIKMHPWEGHQFFKGTNDEHNNILADIIYCHHIYYDRFDGYPYIPMAVKIINKKAVDIVAVADSLDAATDNIGKAYADAISLDDALKELREGEGTRYSPDVVDLFTIPEIYEKAKEILGEEREKIYISCAKEIMENKTKI